MAPVQRNTETGSTMTRTRVLGLLGGFDLTGVHVSTLGNAAQRLLALLGVQTAALTRRRTAQLLYPRATDTQATASLRAVLWRLHRCCPGIVSTTAAEIRLAADVTVDYRNAACLARQLISAGGILSPPELAAAAQGHELRGDLLPSWPEPWLVPEGAHGMAVDVGLAVVNADPLRESAQSVLIDAYLAEGNACEAVRQFGSFRELLEAELGLQPTQKLTAHVDAAARRVSTGS
jgi:DNA-binding SARP family transcriptional activator